MEQFDQLGENLETNVSENQDSKREAKRDAYKKKRDALLDKLKNDPAFAQQLNSLSDTLEVVRALAHPNVKGIIKGEEKEPGKKNLETVPGIVGYTCVNKGTEPLPYYTEVFTKDENGTYVGEVVKRTAQPGEQFDISKYYLTVNTSFPAFSFKLANGNMRRGSKTAHSKEEEIASYYFKPFDEDIKVNSDEFKINIGVKGEDETWGVQDKYLELFGYLLNEEVKAPRESKKKLSNQDISANYVQSLLAGDLM